MNLYLEDLEIGARFTSREMRVEESAIREFAQQFDPQPFHLDQAAGAATLFGGLVASGWHTAAMTMRLLVDGGLPFAGGLIGLGAKIEWPKPTRAGDVLHVVSEILDVLPSRSRPDRGTVRVRSRTLNQLGEAVQIAETKVLAMRRPPTA